MTNKYSAKAAIRIVLTGGGTGGHLYPALAIAATLKKENPDSKILFIGTKDRIEAEKVPAAGFDFKAIDIHGIAGFRRNLKSMVKQIKGIFEFLSGKAVRQSKAILKDFKPDIVVGTGGYVCAPVLIAADKLGIPTVIIDENSLIGNTTRLVSSFVDLAIAISPEAGEYFKNRKVKVVYAGNPIRPEILNTEKNDGIKNIGINENKKVLAVFGGSLGSTPINNAVTDILPILSIDSEFKENWQIVHITGPDRGSGITAEYAADYGIEYYPFLYRDDIENIIAAADFAVTRAGGTFLSELAARGIPMVIIPWSGAANDHQTKNAMPFIDAGAAILIKDDYLSGETLAIALKDVLSDDKKIQEMAASSKSIGKPDATDDIINELYNIILPKGTDYGKNS